MMPFMSQSYNFYFKFVPFPKIEALLWPGSTHIQNVHKDPKISFTGNRLTDRCNPKTHNFLAEILVIKVILKANICVVFPACVEIYPPLKSLALFCLDRTGETIFSVPPLAPVKICIQFYELISNPSRNVYSPHCFTK